MKHFNQKYVEFVIGCKTYFLTSTCDLFNSKFNYFFISHRINFLFPIDSVSWRITWKNLYKYMCGCISFYIDALIPRSLFFCFTISMKNKTHNSMVMWMCSSTRLSWRKAWKGFSELSLCSFIVASL
jgi:hypothetical protein